MAHGGKMVVSGGVQHRVIVPATLEGIRDPSSTDDVVRWAEQAGRVIRPLGGHADDLLSSRVLRFLHDAQANRTRDAPEDALLALLLRQFPARERNDHGVVAAEHDVDRDDLQDRQPELGIRQIHGA